MDFLNSQLYFLSKTLTPSGAILLDVENFPFQLDLTQYLKAYCQYPITIKFAVANWLNNSISKLDKYLYQQGYQLIHVPQGKNSADAQILTLGSSLLLQFPQVKEVVIVSHDSIFDCLHQNLPRQGCSTYKVYQHSRNIYLHNFIDNRTSVISTVSHLGDKSRPTKEPNIEQSIQSKIALTLNKLTQISSEPVTLSQLSQQFKHDYQQSISEVLKSNKIGKSALNFIKQSCVNQIKIKQENKTHYLLLKE
ncbi:NYN domain-containing protein [Pleurocapsa sp. FMAR1]|uniref:NYN domain-containing protein n=1 Tax=Pleurocapsa sp. FMAR1 TaxID=3040204 RepID=UPI0029C75A0E|nr:NYN domain-containing protein [Pleurocapsa sp. FMAR1]